MIKGWQQFNEKKSFVNDLDDTIEKMDTTRKDRQIYYSELKYDNEFSDKVWLDKTKIHIPCKILNRVASRNVTVQVQKPLLHPIFGENGYDGEKNKIVNYTAFNSSPQTGPYNIKHPSFNLSISDY